jgi:hypothetical protein
VCERVGEGGKEGERERDRVCLCERERSGDGDGEVLVCFEAACCEYRCILQERRRVVPEEMDVGDFGKR